MSLSSEAGKALGALWRNLRNPRWLARQAGETALNIYVTNPIGERVIATAKSYIHHDDEHGRAVKIGEVYHCADGYEYVKKNDGQVFVFDPKTKNFLTS